MLAYCCCVFFPLFCLLVTCRWLFAAYTSPLPWLLVHCKLAYWCVSACLLSTCSLQAFLLLLCLPLSCLLVPCMLANCFVCFCHFPVYLSLVSCLIVYVCVFALPCLIDPCMLAYCCMCVLSSFLSTCTLQAGFLLRVLRPFPGSLFIVRRLIAECVLPLPLASCPFRVSFLLPLATCRM